MNINSLIIRETSRYFEQSVLTASNFLSTRIAFIALAAISALAAAYAIFTYCKNSNVLSLSQNIQNIEEEKEDINQPLTPDIILKKAERNFSNNPLRTKIMKKIKEILDDDTTKKDEEGVTSLILDMSSKSALKLMGDMIPKDQIKNLKENAEIEIAIHNFFENLKDIYLVILK